MQKIHDTVSLCSKCYKHIPAFVFEQDGIIQMHKECPEHGIEISTVEVDAEFYYGLEHYRDIEDFDQVLFEASDRCQLNCPHCYHLPDNKVLDRPISNVLEQLSKFPKSCSPMLAGAEATLRPDFVELCQEINNLDFKKFEVLSNGLRFASADFTKGCYDAGLKTMCFGLNHPSYQGEIVHEKQLRALDVLIEHNFDIGYVGYTIETLEHLPFILDEIKKINHPAINHFRIRCGSFIGRSNDKQRSYLSSLVKEVKRITNNEILPYPSDDNPYHVMVSWNGILLRLIQWPDVTNIDMEELATGPWCQFYDGPITNFVHQAITRDAFKNMGKPMLDTAPERYQYRPMKGSHFNYWKDSWKK
jgi:hypothetical protein